MSGRRGITIAEENNVAEFNRSLPPNSITRRGKALLSRNNRNTRALVPNIPMNNTRRKNNNRGLFWSPTNKVTRNSSTKNNPLSGYFTKHKYRLEHTMNNAQKRAARLHNKQERRHPEFYKKQGKP